MLVMLRFEGGCRSVRNGHLRSESNVAVADRNVICRREEESAGMVVDADELMVGSASKMELLSAG